MKYLLDTDTLNHYDRGRHSVVQRAIATGYENLAITIVTRIEVLRARFDSMLKAADAAQLQKAQYWLKQSEQSLERWATVEFSDTSYQEFERLRSYKSLRKIGRADLLIASIALASRAILITRNTRDFTLVPNIRLDNWVD